MAIGLVIPVYNNTEITRRCLDSLEATKALNPLFETVVVDDGSKTDTIAMLQSYNDLHLLQNKTNLGYLDTTNRGIDYCLSHLNCSAVVLLNNDIVFNQNWLERLEKASPKFDLVGYFSHGGVLAHDTYQTDYLEFSCVYITREVLDQVGLLDSQFNKGYYSDNDYCLRVLLHSFRIGVISNDNNSYIHHLCGKTLGKQTRNEFIVEMYDKFAEKWGKDERFLVQNYLDKSVYNPKCDTSFIERLLNAFTRKFFDH